MAQGGADAFIGCIGLGVVSPGQMAMLTGSSHLHIGMAGAPLCGRGMFGSYEGALLPGVHVVEGGQVGGFLGGACRAGWVRGCGGEGERRNALLPGVHVEQGGQVGRFVWGGGGRNVGAGWVRGC